MSIAFITKHPTTLEDFRNIALEEGFTPIKDGTETHYQRGDHRASSVYQWGNRVYFTNFLGNDLSDLMEAVGVVSDLDDDYGACDRSAGRVAKRKGQTKPRSI